MSLTFAATGCGSDTKEKADKAGVDDSSNVDKAGDSNQGADSSGQAEDDDEAVAVDACSLFSKEEMAAQMGADDVTTESMDAVSPTCYYSSEAHYLKAELAVLDEEQLANTPRDPNAYLGGQADSKVELLDVSGIGDEVFGSKSKGGVTLVAGVGDKGYSLLLTNAGGGADAGNWVDEDAMVASAIEI